MKMALREAAGGRMAVVVFDKGDEVISGLTDIARERQIRGAGLTAIGAFQWARLGYFDRERMQYEEIRVDDQVEVLSLVGDIALKGDEPKIHAHVVVGHRDGSTSGGHVLEASVWPTLEVVITETPPELQRRHDDETGLPLIELPEWQGSPS